MVEVGISLQVQAIDLRDMRGKLAWEVENEGIMDRKDIQLLGSCRATLEMPKRRRRFFCMLSMDKRHYDFSYLLHTVWYLQRNPYAHKYIVSSFGHRLKYLWPGGTAGHPAPLDPLNVDTYPNNTHNVELDVRICQIPQFWWIETAMLYLPKPIRAKTNKRSEAFQKDHSDWSWLHFGRNLQTVLSPANVTPGPCHAQSAGLAPAASVPSGRTILFKPRAFWRGTWDPGKH